MDKPPATNDSLSSEHIQERLTLERTGQIQSKAVMDRFHAFCAGTSARWLSWLRPWRLHVPYPDWEGIARKQRDRAILGAFLGLITIALFVLIVWGIVWSFMADAEAERIMRAKQPDGALLRQ
jgi:hypothetical protein